MHNTTPIAGERADDALVSRFKVDVPWTAEHEDYARQKWIAGESAGQIGRALGRSRNSVCAKLDRMSLLKTRKTPPANLKRPHLNAGRPPNKPLHLRPAGDTHKLRGSAWEQIADTPPVSLLDLEPGMCKWPIGDDRPYRFCGSETPEGKPYCDHHKRVSQGAA